MMGGQDSTAAKTEERRYLGRSWLGRKKGRIW
jgi:hypothetical protein